MSRKEKSLTRGLLFSIMLILMLASSLLFLGSGVRFTTNEKPAILYAMEAMEGMEATTEKHAVENKKVHGVVTPEKHIVGSEDAHGDEKHGEEDKDGHGHGVPSIGYIGLEHGAKIDAASLNIYKDRVEKEAIIKGKLDAMRFIFFALSFIAVCLAFAKISILEPVTKRLRKSIDWHTLGTVTGLILVVLVIPSGIIITFFFMPTSTGVYSSVEAMTSNHFLAFFRNMHNWSSEVFMWLMLLHTARTISTHTFLGNRKFIWLTGAVVAVVGWVAFLSGTFMRGDQEALEGFEHMMYSFKLFPGGGYIASFFSGEYTLIRLTTLHIIATIFVMVVLLAMHVLMRKIHVLIVLRWKKAVIYFGVLTLFMTVQSIFMEAPFVRGLVNAPTISGIEFTKPPWPIYFLIQGENWFGANAMVLILLVVFVPLVILPYVIEFLPISSQRKQVVGEWAFYTGVFLLILVSFIAAGGPIIAHIS